MTSLAGLEQPNSAMALRRNEMLHITYSQKLMEKFTCSITCENIQHYVITYIVPCVRVRVRTCVCVCVRERERERERQTEKGREN